MVDFNYCRAVPYATASRPNVGGQDLLGTAPQVVQGKWSNATSMVVGDGLYNERRWC